MKRLITKKRILVLLVILAIPAASASAATRVNRVSDLNRRVHFGKTIKIRIKYSHSQRDGRALFFKNDGDLYLKVKRQSNLPAFRQAWIDITFGRGNYYDVSFRLANFYKLNRNTRQGYYIDNTRIRRNSSNSSGSSTSNRSSSSSTSTESPTYRPDTSDAMNLLHVKQERTYLKKYWLPLKYNRRTSIGSAGYYYHYTDSQGYNFKLQNVPRDKQALFNNQVRNRTYIIKYKYIHYYRDIDTVKGHFTP